MFLVLFHDYYAAEAARSCVRRPKSASVTLFLLIITIIIAVFKLLQVSLIFCNQSPDFFNKTIHKQTRRIVSSSDRFYFYKFSSNPPIHLAMYISLFLDVDS